MQSGGNKKVCPTCSKELTHIETEEGDYYVCHVDDGGCSFITYKDKG